MKIQEVKRKEPKSVQISIRTTEEFSKFMRDNRISPNAVFQKSMEELVKEK